MRKQIRRAASVLLAVLLCFPLASSVFAAPDTDVYRESTSNYEFFDELTPEWELLPEVAASPPPDALPDLPAATMPPALDWADDWHESFYNERAADNALMEPLNTGNAPNVNTAADWARPAINQLWRSGTLRTGGIWNSYWSNISRLRMAWIMDDLA
ncbi:MAG: hypothetical protein FWE06_06785 [Oscillospiraceae bacterium]|nr:hypothetical protein [Oscillospiraceae bacterium]